jgi:hypothetical protein
MMQHRKEAKIGKKSWTPIIALQSDPSRIDPKYFLPILSLDRILLELESR